jgi:hypothetical protein
LIATDSIVEDSQEQEKGTMAKNFSELLKRKFSTLHALGMAALMVLIRCAAVAVAERRTPPVSRACALVLALLLAAG